MDWTAGDVWFEDGFEAAAVADLVPGTWSESVKLGGVTNTVETSTIRKRSGERSLAATATATVGGLTSKALIQLEDTLALPLRLYEGDRVRIAAYFYIVGTANLQGLFLIDLESQSCWDPAITGFEDAYGANPSPGLRLTMSGGNDYLAVERGKIGYVNNITQTAPVHFPRDQWVLIEWDVLLNAAETGTTSVRMNGTEIISGTDVATFPDDDHVAEFLSYPGFQFLHPVYYDRIQVGITANDTGSAVALYVDDVTFSARRPPFDRGLLLRDRIDPWEAPAPRWSPDSVFEKTRHP